MFSVFLSFFAALGPTVDAQCKTFHYSSNFQVASVGFESLLYKDSLAPLNSQIQQVTPAFTCDDPTAFNKQHETNHSILFVCSFQHGCAYPSTGNTYAKAMTNLSYATNDDKEANDRITSLAQKQVHWPRAGTHKAFTLVYQTELRGFALQNPICLQQGEGGWGIFAPTFHCVNGTLMDCNTGGSILEQDGRGVSVCMPFSYGTKGTQDPSTQIVGFFLQTGNKSAAEVAQHRHNPALDEPAPNGATSINTAFGGSKSLISAVLVSLCIWFSS